MLTWLNHSIPLNDYWINYFKNTPQSLSQLIEMCEWTCQRSKVSVCAVALLTQACVRVRFKAQWTWSLILNTLIIYALKTFLCGNLMKAILCMVIYLSVVAQNSVIFYPDVTAVRVDIPLLGLSFRALASKGRTGSSQQGAARTQHCSRSVQHFWNCYIIAE